ncbi:hypothetical protein L9F63_007201, partial [Diploptera punctata]
SFWEMYMVFIFYISMMEIPMGSAFRLKEIVAFKAFDLFLSTMCLMDCAFTFFCGYYDNNNHEVVLKYSTAAKRYLTSYFWPDIISAIPFEIIIEAFAHIEALEVILSVLPLIKLLRMFSLLMYFKQLTLELDLGELTIMISRFILLATLYIQWVSCGYYFIPALLQLRYSEKPANSSWIIFKGLVNQTAWKQYQFSLFRGVTTIFNVAMVEVSTLEDIFYECVVAMSGQIFLILMLVLTYQVRSAMIASKRIYQSMEQELREFMKHNRLPMDLQKRILMYYDFRFRKRYFREQEILETLTGQLSEDIVMYNCRKLVENVDFLKDLPIDLLLRIVAHLKSEIYLTDDVIVKVGSKGDFMYFIASGSVAVLGPDNQPMVYLDEGSHFGEIAIIMEFTRTATVVAVETCELYRLDRVDFRAAIGPYPDLLVKIEQIARRRFQETQEHRRAASVPGTARGS